MAKGMVKNKERLGKNVWLERNAKGPVKEWGDTGE